MNEKKPLQRGSLAEILDVMGLEMIKGKAKFFPPGEKIYVFGAKLTPVTITSGQGLTGQQVRRKKGREGRMNLVVEGQVVELPDLEVKIDGKKRYVLTSQEASVDEAGRDKIITRGFLFWAY